MTHPTRAPKQSGLAIVAILVVAVVTLYYAQDILKPIVLSILLAFLLARPVSWLERRRWPRVPAVLAVVTVAFVVIGGIGYVVGQQVVSLARNLDSYQDEIGKKVRSIRGSSSGVGNMFNKLSHDLSKAATQPAKPEGAKEGPATTKAAADATGDAKPDGVVGNAAQQISDDPVGTAVRENAKPAPATAPAPPAAAGTTPANPLYTVSQGQPESPVQTLITYLGVVAGPLGTAGLVVVFVVFILLEREALRDRFIAVISRGNYTTTTRAINDATERISRYLVAQSIVNGSYGVIIALGLLVIGLVFRGHGDGAHVDPVFFPSLVLWGLLCAVLRFIPYVGPAVSSIFPVVVALAVYQGFTVAIAVVALFVIVELISNNVMEPWLYGASTGLSNVAIIVAATFWTSLWGSVGLLVATPLTVCMAVIGKYVEPLRFMHILLGDEDALPPAVSFYQRLLAGDQADAERIVKRVADAKGHGQVADTVYLPALRMARRDRSDDELTAEDETRIFDDTLAIVRPPGSVVVPAPTPVVAVGHPLVLACPAHHRADEVTLHVLAEALSPLAVRTTVLSTRTLPADVEAAIERDKPAVVVIAVMPPGGQPQARYLCRRLRKKFPDLPILVGFWGRVRNFDRLLVSLRKAGASYVLTSVEQTRGQIGAMLPRVAPTQVPTPEPTTLS